VLGRTDPTRAAAAALVARAEQARARGDFTDAAFFYDEALKLRPERANWRVQAGHMHKEAGAFDAAEACYLAALAARPKDADLALQLGHFYKVAGRLDRAEAEYRRAADLKPGWQPPLDELLGLAKSGWRGKAAAAALEPPHRFEDIDLRIRAELAPYVAEADRFARAGAMDGLVPKLVPRRPQDLLHHHPEGVDVRRLGRREEGFWGLRRTLRGVEAVRGFCVSRVPVTEIAILLNGLAIHRGPVTGGYVLKFERERSRLRKYVFNVWLDTAALAHGLHAIELRFTDANGDIRSWHDEVVIARAIDERDYPGSDTLVSIDRADPRPIEQQIRTRPSMVRDARRALFPDGVRSVLVMRTDQLGDMVASVPALIRLREIVPGARIVGLVTIANYDLAVSLKLFDEIIVADFPDDRTERRRLMPLAEQEALRDRLAPYQFDIAIDLAQSNVSRDLLRLSGAKFIHGTGGEDWPWLSSDFIFNSHDRWNGMDNTPHSTKVLALVEALGALLSGGPPVIRRDDLTPEMLADYGVGAGQRFAVLHAGARVEFSRWPYYPQLAAMLLAATDLKIVMMSEEPGFRETLPAELLTNPRFVLLDKRLPFEIFDAFISFATVVVGNDSGPKHLASLRGTNVVTLFTARINWSEWGQENVGAIISRRVPCAGCALFHDPEECGKDFACIRDVRPQEVFDTVMRYV
jgi:ADP-heptose:LPS heptosyltransferase/Flp pilus assembly protein TadD